MLICTNAVFVNLIAIHFSHGEWMDLLHLTQFVLSVELSSDTKILLRKV